MKRVGVVFPGQGSQSVGMGGELASRSSLVADLFARARQMLGYDLLAIVRDGPEHTLRETRYSQPAIYVTNYALAMAAGAEHVAVVTAGHSFGELCSLTLAGAISFETGLALVRERALAMQEAAAREPGAMAAILGLDEPALRAVLVRARDAGRVQIANFNAPGQIVVSGEEDAVGRAGRLALDAGAKRVVPLNVSGAWHSDLMAPARRRFEPFVAAAAIDLPRIPVVSNVDARPYGDVATIRGNLVRSVTDEVLWHAVALELVGRDLDLIVEFGGSAVLGPLFKRLPGAPKAIHVGDPAGLDKLATLLPAAPV
ncbi:MAG: ACP S-malonyltransferase [Vulcanimicrobiaceae bacterium]